MAISVEAPILSSEEAAKQIRVILAKLQNDAAAGSVGGTVLDDLLYRIERVRQSLDASQLHKQRMMAEFQRIEASLRERRTAPGLTALHAATVALIGMDAGQSIKRLGNTRVVLEQIKDNGGSLGAGGDSSTLKKLFKLSQSLATVDDIPKTPAENTLRAICALLRHHKWPGSEDLDQKIEKEEVIDSATISEELHEIAAEVGGGGIGTFVIDEFSSIVSDPAGSPA